jgi:hypothetical protein
MWQILVWIAVAGEYLIASDRNVIGEMWLRDSRGKAIRLNRNQPHNPTLDWAFSYAQLLIKNLNMRNA